MKVLITSARFPHAVAEVRKFGSQGHEVYAADTFWTSPGIHSRYAKKALLVARPAFEPQKFIEDIAKIIEEYSIELLVPTCEEGFFLARHLDALPNRAEFFFPPFETMARLHNKQTFVELAQSLGLRVPATIVAKSQSELAAASGEFPEYIARAAFSRGGTKLLTNVGPLAGRVRIEECHPSPERPWLLQQFMHGRDVCSFSVAHRGRVTAHCAYEHPKVIEHAGGISYVTVEQPESLSIAQKIVQALGYHGQISFDFIQTDAGLTLIECNPRPTAGVCMMPAKDFVDAVINPSPTGPAVVQAGIREHSAVALVRDMFQDPQAIPSDIKALFSGVPDVYWQREDRLPGFFQLLSYTQLLSYRRQFNLRTRRSVDLIEAQFYDIAWNGRALT